MTRERPVDALSLGALAKALAGRAAKRRATATDRVGAAWDELVGADLSARTRVRSVRDGVATVCVASGPLCHELASFRKEELLASLNERLAARRVAPVRSLVFRIGVP
jgi:predicted nucleic acid-binding Zn ribbon protein